MEQSMNRYIGQMLDDRYEILEIIGSGGMSVVYKAMCHKLHHYVAVKILRDEMAADAELKNRFQAEAHAVAMLSQPNIVSVYDVGHSGETEYIVMELIEGETLKQRMAEHGVFSATEALHYATQICFASREPRQKSCIWPSDSVLDSPSVHSSSRAPSGNGSVRQSGSTCGPTPTARVITFRRG